MRQKIFNKIEHKHCVKWIEALIVNYFLIEADRSKVARYREYSKLGNFCGDSAICVWGDEAQGDDGKLGTLEFKGIFGGNELILLRVFTFGSSAAFPLLGRPKYYKCKW